MSTSNQITRDLIDVAMGRQPADLVLRKGTWVCVQSGEFVQGTDVAVRHGRIAYVGPDASHTIAKNTVVIDAAGKYLVPGLLDGHTHVESGMFTVTGFVRAVLPHGTTGIFADPHEIANVFGLKGVRLMADEAAVQPIHVWMQVPSCVPSAPGLETAGGEITPGDVTKALTWERVIGLGEVMNYAGVAEAQENLLEEMAATHLAGKVVGGHYASPDLGLPFHAYAAGGADDDHEGTRLEDAIARARQGMRPMLRYSSAWHDVAAQAPAITKNGLDSRHFILCGDDCHAETLIAEGHMDRILRHAIKQGIPPMTAVQMATLNTAEHFGLSKQIGQIAPGRWADILLVKDLKDFRAELVIARGKIAARNGKLVTGLPKYDYPDWVYKSIHCKLPISERDFVIKAAGSLERVKVNVIGVIENQAPNRHLTFEVKPENGEIRIDLERDLAKVAVLERHKKTGNVQVGLVTGFGLGSACAIASTVAHDCHNLIVVGTDEKEMALAATRLVELGGGQVVVRNGKVIGLLELPIGGLISDQDAEKIAGQAKTVLDGFRSCGCRINNPNMTLSLLALPVIPELRLTDKGLVDVKKFSFINVVEKG